VLLVGSHGLKGCPIVISQTVLVVAGPFGDALSAEEVARAIGRGLVAGGLPEPDLCPIDGDSSSSHPGQVHSGRHPGPVRARLDALDFDARMRRARAVVLAEWRLEESALRGSAAFEIATRARQGGVPAYAVTGENALSRFDARILDLQVIVEAHIKRTLVSAGTKLAQVI
jgi:Glycerate kinase family